MAAAAGHRDGELGMGFGARGWMNWRRGTDYYDEGDLLWLEVATIIHRESHGTKSIDDFCHAFHGGANNGPEVKTYTFDQLVSDLNAIAPFDWATFFRTRLDSTSPKAPTGGIENGGWKVIYTDQPAKLEGRRGNPGDVYSIGLQVGADGTGRRFHRRQSRLRSRRFVGHEGRRRQWPRLYSRTAWRRHQGREGWLQADHAAGGGRRLLSDLLRSTTTMVRAIRTWCAKTASPTTWTN